MFIILILTLACKLRACIKEIKILHSGLKINRFTVLFSKTFDLIIPRLGYWI